MRRSSRGSRSVRRGECARDGSGPRIRRAASRSTPPWPPRPSPGRTRTLQDTGCSARARDRVQLDMTDRRSRRTRAGLQSGRSLNACTETATAEQPEAAVRDRSRNQPRSRERRRRASPHVSRADMLGITKPSRQRNPARYRIEAARARRAPTRNRRREARPVLARRRPRRGPKAEGRSLFQSDARATECRWTTRPLGVGHPARTPTAFSYVAMTTRSDAWARVRKAPRRQPALRRRIDAKSTATYAGAATGLSTVSLRDRRAASCHDTTRSRGKEVRTMNWPHHAGEGAASRFEHRRQVSTLITRTFPHDVPTTSRNTCVPLREVLAEFGGRSPSL